MKLAQFRSIGERSYESVLEEWADGSSSYVRISEFVEVEFPPLHNDEVVQRQLDGLDRVEQALREKFQEALGGLERQRAELRAITYQG